MRFLIGAAAVLALTVASLPAADTKDTPKAAATKKKLKQKVSVDFKDTPLSEVVDDIKQQVSGIGILIDTKGGVSRNQTVTFKADDAPLEEVLDKMLKKADLHYIVISKENDAYDGSLMIKKGKE